MPDDATSDVNIHVRVALVEAEVRTLKLQVEDHGRKLDKLLTNLNRGIWIICGLGAGGKLLTPEGIEFLKSILGVH